MESRVVWIDSKPKIKKRLRVAAYARVSSSKDAMLHSLEAQTNHYNDFININPDWDFIGVYSDEGITGTKQARPGFQALLEDCKAHIIDMVVVKSISRFARNTMTLIESVRELKTLGINIYFEEENINTLSAEGEMVITFLAAHAQEQSRSVSENMKWRIIRDMREGIGWGLKDNYGYDIIDKKFIINPEKAGIIRRIFDLYLNGMGSQAIANLLNFEGVPTAYNRKWCKSGVMGIINNYNYTGDLILQKTFREDYITKKTKLNRGELDSYFIEGDHEAIISKADFYKAQELKSLRAQHYKVKDVSNIKYPFSKMLRCSCCGKNYKHKTSRGIGSWVCTTFSTEGKKACQSKAIPDDVLNELVIDSFGSIEVYKEKVAYIDVCQGNKIVFNLKDGSQREMIWRDKSRKQSWTPEMREKARIRTLENGTNKNIKEGQKNGKSNNNTINN